jgi:ATP-binding cassette, subfamily B, bacterial
MAIKTKQNKEKIVLKRVTIKTLFKKYFFYLFVLIFISIIANAISIYIPKLIGEYIDGSKNTLQLILLIIFGLFFAILEVCFGVWFSEVFSRDLKKDAFKNLSKQPYQYVTNQGSSNLITIFNSDIDNIQENFTTAISYIFQSIVLLLSSIILMFLTSWKLALVAIISLPFIVTVFMFSIKRVSKFFRLSQLNLTKLNTLVSENINGAALVRVLKSENWEEQKFENTNLQSKTISLNIVKLFSILIPSITLITSFINLIFIYLGAFEVYRGELSVGQLTAFLGYYVLLITPIFILGFTSQGISQALNSWKRVAPILNVNLQENTSSIVNIENQRNTNKNTSKYLGSIELKNITLEYGGKKILDDISFIIKNGENTAIIGPTGAGKSQLLNIILGLLQPTSGTIKINKTDISKWDKDILYSNIGIVFQESLIFNSTIGENISLSRVGINEEMIVKAMKTSEIGTLDIKEQIYERGANLSGGQKQRLTLARALVNNPKLLLLDDFTARVDTQTEEKIKLNLINDYPTTQIIQICQKISSIEDYSNIIVIMEGQLLGVGTHLELLKNCIEYKQIYESQKTI